MFKLQAATARDDSDRMRKVFESKAAGVKNILIFDHFLYVFHPGAPLKFPDI